MTSEVELTLAGGASRHLGGVGVFPGGPWRARLEALCAGIRFRRSLGRLYRAVRPNGEVRGCGAGRWLLQSEAASSDFLAASSPGRREAFSEAREKAQVALAQLDGMAPPPADLIRPN